MKNRYPPLLIASSVALNIVRYIFRGAFFRFCTQKASPERGGGPFAVEGFSAAAPHVHPLRQKIFPTLILS